MLDAPGLIDDFYASLIDWSQQGLLAAALGMELYVSNTITSKVRDNLYEHSYAQDQSVNGTEVKL